MRKKMIILMISLWMIAFVGMIFTGMNDNEELDLVTAFSNEKYMYTESFVNGKASIGNSYYTKDEKEEYLKDVANKLGINTECEFVEVRDDNIVTAKLTKVAKNAITNIKLTTIETVKEKNIITLKNYLEISIEMSNSLDSAVAYGDIIENIFKSKGVIADVTVNLKGSIEGELSNSEKNDITDKIMDKMNADIVTGNRTKEIYTVYGYSEEMEDYVVFGSTKTNVNVAITYDELNNETLIYMATPIINQDF